MTDIAVVVPTFRRPDRALRLIDALEQQTLPRDRFEVVFVDDSSGDGSFEQLHERAELSPVRIRVLSTRENSGPATARNLGWRSTDAPLIAFTDDDCVPSPQWLEAALAAFDGDRSLGVVQGQTTPPGTPVLGDWTLWRQVTDVTPFFEGCDIFYRREALEATGGFDESIRYGEDTAAGWAVFDAGWSRGFAADAVVHHDVEERGIRWHIRYGYREHGLIAIAARHPGFRREAFWRPWAFRRDNALCSVALLGVLLGLRWRPALLLTLPYFRWRRPPPRHHRWLALMLERIVVDVAQSAGHAVGSVRHRIFVL